jgi:hypothetical protein
MAEQTKSLAPRDQRVMKRLEIPRHVLEVIKEMADEEDRTDSAQINWILKGVAREYLSRKATAPEPAANQ